MAQFIAIPVATSAPFEVIPVAPANGLKTLLQVKPVTKDLLICAWGAWASGSAAGAPIQLELLDSDVTATVTALTPTRWDNEDGAATLAVGGTSATGYNASAEGTLTAARLLDGAEIRPDGGAYVMWFPLGAQPKLAAGRFLRIRSRNTATTPTVIPWIIFDDV